MDYLLAGLWFVPELIEGAFHAQSRFLYDVQMNLRGPDVAVSHQILLGVDVSPAFQQVRGKRVPETMRGCALYLPFLKRTHSTLARACLIGNDGQTTMKLVQKSFPFHTVTFEIIDGVLHVENRRLQSSNAFEVPVQNIESRITKMRQFPIGWMLLGVGGCIGCVALLVGAIYATGDGQLGAFALSFCALVFSAFAWHGFFERKYDYIILHSRETGQPIIHIDRTTPSLRHVEEFVEILKEGLEVNREN